MSKTATYALIDSYTVTGSNLSGLTGVTFTNIPNTYTDLILVQNCETTAAAIALIRVGKGVIDTGSAYSRTDIAGDGSTATSHRTSNTTAISTQYAHNAAIRTTHIYHFLDYSNTTTFKTMLARHTNSFFGTEATVGLWRNATNIEMIQVFLDRAESYVVGSTFKLYGIQAGNA